MLKQKLDLLFFSQSTIRKAGTLSFLSGGAKPFDLSRYGSIDALVQWTLFYGVSTLWVVQLACHQKAFLKDYYNKIDCSSIGVSVNNFSGSSGVR